MKLSPEVEKATLEYQDLVNGHAQGGTVSAKDLTESKLKVADSLLRNLKLPLSLRDRRTSGVPDRRS